MTEKNAQADAQSHVQHPTDEIRFVATGALPWEDVGPGVTVRTLPATPHNEAWIVRWAPGARWPGVDIHGGEERYYVLSGSLVDEGRLHREGDYVVLDKGTSHSPYSDTGATLLVTSTLV
ncbi:anti-sigma factor [Streptomyces sp. A7024]|uniref:Anti-sigma factor n=1 Tax=Streptomyces coryli TaxID=1128680 RepID=A0A6G4UD64_9ACTN|nr:cupin domain-containing protein [Streptomyces coryli]NGN69952.1 anti-sigma factor [Streptomyces coryli]